MGAPLVATMNKSLFKETIQPRLSMPLIAAPMFRVSGPDLVSEACRAGVIGSFPHANCRTSQEFDDWIVRIKHSVGSQHAPYCPNLIMRRESLWDDVATIIKHRCEMVVTSVGAPDPVIKPLHDAHCLVFADVASIRHARKAIAAGVDGLVLLTAGAGGQTGWANGFSFVRAVRGFYEGPIVLAGGASDGHAVFAAEILGCDLVYMGTKFIATEESMASYEHKAMLVTSELDDILLSRAFTGLETNTLIPSIIAAGLDPKNLPDDMSKEGSDALYGSGASSRVRRWRDIWSAGHSVSGVEEVLPTRELVARLRREYDDARLLARRRLEPERVHP